MKVAQIMSSHPACCTPDMRLQQVAQIFVDHDCGAVPVVDDLVTRRPIGVITDRDIACRAIAAGLNALELTARQCMSSPCVTIGPGASLEECCEAMEKNRVRRVIVIDETGGCCGIVSQADIALAGRIKTVGEVVKEISEPTPSASGIHH
jgi:CBS domain-containing protein